MAYTSAIFQDPLLTLFVIIVITLIGIVIYYTFYPKNKSSIKQDTPFRKIGRPIIHTDENGTCEGIGFVDNGDGYYMVHLVNGDGRDIFKEYHKTEFEADDIMQVMFGMDAPIFSVKGRKKKRTKYDYDEDFDNNKRMSELQQYLNYSSANVDNQIDKIVENTAKLTKSKQKGFSRHQGGTVEE